MKPCLAAAIAATLALASGQAAGLTPGAEPPPTYKAMARGILAQLIGIDSTHAHGSLGAAVAMQKRALAAGFAPADVTVVAPPDHPTKGNVVIRLHGRGLGKPLLFIGHLDVVEVDPKAWSSDPFKLVARDGYFYGRGTEDMKGEDAVILTALIRLKQEGFVPDRDIILALTADEEAGGDADGVQYLFAKHKDLVDSDLVLNVDDSGGRILGGKRVYIGVETSEKLYATYEFSTANPGGHSSLPRPDNAIYQMTEALQKLAAYQFPARTTATTRAYFAALANLRSGAEQADMRAVARATPDPAAVAHHLRRHHDAGWPGRKRAAEPRPRHRAMPPAARRHTGADLGDVAPCRRRPWGENRCGPSHRPQPGNAAHARHPRALQTGRRPGLAQQRDHSRNGRRCLRLCVCAAGRGAQLPLLHHLHRGFTRPCA